MSTGGEPHPLAWFQSPEAGALLARVGRAAATPVALHHVQDDQESPRIAACGACAACLHVCGVPEGRSACRASRVAASSRAARRDGAVPFVCHMGFACVTARVLPGHGYVLTAGPYVPPGSGDSLALDAEAGLEALGMRAGDAPAGWLDGIAAASPRAVAEVAAWGAEALAAGWNALPRETPQQAEGDAAGIPTGGGAHATPRRGRHGGARRSEGSEAAAIAAALAAGSAAGARDLARSALGDPPKHPHGHHAVRARVVALAAGVLEAAQTARLDTAPAWDRFPSLLATPRDAPPEAGLSALMDVLETLRPPRKRPARQEDAGMQHDVLHRLVSENLEDGITLTEVAKRLSRSPSAVTRGLQRRYGMSFTEYANRLRVDRAKELLRRTQLRIGEVARRVGLTDTSNLGRLFRRFEGMSPGDYRNRHRDRR